MKNAFGPRTDFGQMIHAMKYRSPEESFDDYCIRYARATCDTEPEFRTLLRLLRDQVVLPAGRQQIAVGRPHRITAFNCFVGAAIPDDTRGIFDAVTESAITLRSGGGCGWDYSTLRPDGELVRGLGLGAKASGPLSFMDVWNSMCGTIMSAGERRGAMMGVLRCDHPDIMKFVRAKQTPGRLTNFNVSIAATDEFMEAVNGDKEYELKFDGRSYGSVRALDVWGPIMEGTWDWAEPGILFIDRINRMNPLRYCETIAATNPCGEQPLPPNGACLLGSVNMMKLLQPAHEVEGLKLAAQDGRQKVRYEVDYSLLDAAVDAMVRAFDNVIDRTTYPLEAQRAEAVAKRRMGVGVTGMANALETMGLPYATPDYLRMQEHIMQRITEQAYATSCALAQTKGPFPLWDKDEYCKGEFFKSLPEGLRRLIESNGLRNGLLTSIAPTGTISLAADNVSSGIEPVYQHRALRDIITPEGKREFEVVDAAFNQYGTVGRLAEDVGPLEHVAVLCSAQKWVDSSISKTINVKGQVGGEGPGTTFSEFKDVYLKAYEGGAKGVTTFNSSGKRMGILRPADVQESTGEGAACVFDPSTGLRSCDA
jgi:ribonucleoside-diphosphate reductase alpha chain